MGVIMKKFKIYAKIAEYIVLRCPYCEREFRYDPSDNIFGKEKKNAKCQKCEKMFSIKENQLDKDPLPKIWEYKDMIMIKPNKEQIFFEKDKINLPKIESAEKLQD